MILIDCYNKKNTLKRETMKYSNTLVATIAVAFLATGCVKPTEPAQPQNPVVYDNSQPTYEDGTPIVYENTTTAPSGVIYSELPADGTVITTPTGGTSTEVYTNPYETGGATSYPDPYANGGATTYPAATSYPAPVTAAVGQGGGIHLQIAALKDYYAAEEFKNTLSLAPGQSAYVQRGPMNKVIVTGISSMQEANQLKETRFPGAFIVQGSGGGYTPPVTPAYDTGAYTTNDPYGTPSAAPVGNTGIGVQIGAFSTNSKAQSVADANRGQYSPIVKKIGGLYKVILTGFPNRSAAKAHASQVGGFVVSTY